jgi:hypothetical protein
MFQQVKDFISDQDMQALESKRDSTSMAKPKDFISDAEMEEMGKKGPHGASGDWLPDLNEQIMSPSEAALRTVAEPLSAIGKGAVTSAKNTITVPYNIGQASVQPPTNEYEELLSKSAGFGYGGIGLAINRLIINPSIDNIKKAFSSLQSAKPGTRLDDYLDSIYHAASAIPVVGPQIQEWAEKIRDEGPSAIPEIIGKIGMYMVAPKVVGETVGAAGRAIAKEKAYFSSHPAVKFTPEGHLYNALKPDLDMEGTKLAGSELKAGELKTGKPVKDIDTARGAAQAQFRDELMPARRNIIDPQAIVEVSGSRDVLIRAKIDAIPADIRPGSPEYKALVEKARSSIPKDLNLGELEKMNSSLNQQTRTFHQSKLSVALSKEESASGAMDIAAERATRQLMEQGMEKQGLGGNAALKQINKRIGALIKIEDGIDTVEKQARLESNMPWLHLYRIPSPWHPSIYRSGEVPINTRIARAMKNWEGTNPPIPSGLRSTANPPRMLPAHTSTDLGASPDTSSVIGSPAIYSPPGRPRMLSARAGGPYSLPETTTPPPSMESGVTGTPAEYNRFARIRGTGPYAKLPRPGKPGQMSLQPTVIKEGGKPANPIIGEKQSSLGQRYQDISNMVTVYRGEISPSGKSTIPFWIDPSQNPGIKAARRWFTDSLENAQWYKNEAGSSGRIVSVQIPRDVWERAKIAPEVKKWSRRPESEGFVPEEYVDKAEVLKGHSVNMQPIPPPKRSGKIKGKQ